MFDPATSAAVSDAANGLLRELPANAAAALGLVPLLEKLKKSAWIPFINKQTAPWISLASSALLAGGIHGTITANGFALDGTWLGIMTGTIAVAKEWVAQHWGYKLYQGIDALKSLAVLINAVGAIPTQSVKGANPETEHLPVVSALRAPGLEGK